MLQITTAKVIARYVLTIVRVQMPNKQLIMTLTVAGWEFRLCVN